MRQTGIFLGLFLLADLIHPTPAFGGRIRRTRRHPRPLLPPSSPGPAASDPAGEAELRARRGSKAAARTGPAAAI